MGTQIYENIELKVSPSLKLLIFLKQSARLAAAAHVRRGNYEATEYTTEKLKTREYFEIK